MCTTGFSFWLEFGGATNGKVPPPPPWICSKKKRTNFRCFPRALSFWTENPLRIFCWRKQHITVHRLPCSLSSQPSCDPFDQGHRSRNYSLVFRLHQVKFFELLKIIKKKRHYGWKICNKGEWFSTWTIIFCVTAVKLEKYFFLYIFLAIQLLLSSFSAKTQKWSHGFCFDQERYLILLVLLKTTRLPASDIFSSSFILYFVSQQKIKLQEYSKFTSLFLYFVFTWLICTANS